jgi:8-oxo-dGTP pyrophosphatase MutT (NUDIX family)
MSEASDGLRRKPVVTAFLRHRGRVLLVRRSRKVGSYQGRWSAISGHLEDPTPLQQALREIREETGLAPQKVRLVAAAQAFEVAARELETCWVVHPFLFEIDDPGAVRLDWENTELRWVTPEQLRHLPTVPALAQALEAVVGP